MNSSVRLRLALALLAVLPAVSSRTEAALSVGPAGAGPITFATQPSVADGWSTMVIAGASTDFTTAAALDAAVSSTVAAAMTTPVGSTATTTPSISPANIPRWNSSLQLLQTVATSAGYIALLATLHNDTGGDLSQIRVSYTFNELHAAGTTVVEEVPGHRVYWSLTGAAGSWQVIGALSSIGTPGTLTAVLGLGNWASGTPLYLLWVDDNANAARDNAGNEDGGYTLDNFTVSLSTEGVVITAPSDGQVFVAGASITVSAEATLPGTVNNVQFRSNGGVIGNDSVPPYSISYNNPPLGTNLLTAVATDNLGNSRTSSVVRAIVNPNQAPVVTLVSPGAFDYITASNTALWATATDADGSVAQVRFYDGATLLGTDTTGPSYNVNWPSASGGTHILTAVATDNAGLAATSAPVTVRFVTPPANLVPFGAAWRYLDTGTDQGPPGGIGSWTDFQFDDSSWSNGVAELGYGDNDESTVVRFGPDPNNKFITTYFRHRFDLADPNNITSLGVRLRADDGAVVYLNNQVLLSYNMPGAPTFQTLATAGVEDDPVLGTNIVVDGLNVALLFENILAVEVHQSATNSSDISFDLELTANPVNTPPVVTFNTPTPTDLISAPATIPINVSSYDLDGGITSMDFYDNGTFLGSFVLSYFVGTYNNVQPGLHTISAIVTDNSGLTATSTVTVLVRAAPIDVVLVQTNSVWSYLDDGSDQGTAWRDVLFPGVDTWPAGMAELGYGDGDEVTVVNFGPDPNNKFITTYFRRVFNVASTSGYTNIQVRLRRDDGGIVYVNGAEVFRSNMPLGPVNYRTLAGANIVSETAFSVGNFSPSLLVLGDNVVAVEVHQNAPNSSDMSFELQLVGQYPPPALAIQPDAGDPTLLHLSWAPALPGYQLEEAADLAGPWTPSPDQNNPQLIVFDLNDPPKFYRLVAP